METFYGIIQTVLKGNDLKPDYLATRNKNDGELRVALLKYVTNIWLGSVDYYPVLGKMLNPEDPIVLEHFVARLKSDVLCSSKPYFLGIPGIRATRTYEHSIREIRGIIQIPGTLEPTDISTFFTPVRSAILVSLVLLLGMVVSTYVKFDPTNLTGMLYYAMIFSILLSTGFIFSGAQTRRKIERAGNVMLEQAAFLDIVAAALREVPDGSSDNAQQPTA